MAAAGEQYVWRLTGLGRRRIPTNWISALSICQSSWHTKQPTKSSTSGEERVLLATGSGGRARAQGL